MIKENIYMWLKGFSIILLIILFIGLVFLVPYGVHVLWGDLGDTVLIASIIFIAIPWFIGKLIEEDEL